MNNLLSVSISRIKFGVLSYDILKFDHYNYEGVSIKDIIIVDMVNLIATETVLVLNIIKIMKLRLCVYLTSSIISHEKWPNKNTYMDDGENTDVFTEILCTVLYYVVQYNTYLQYKLDLLLKLKSEPRIELNCF